MVTYKNDEEIEIMRQGGRILAEIIDKICSLTRAGVTGIELQEIADKMAKKNGARPAFLGFGGYPSSLCVSVNEKVVHGLPNEIPFNQGDVVKLDYGVEYKGLNTDMAKTVIIGKVDRRVKKLVEVTKRSLDKAINEVKVGNRIGDISRAVQSEVEKNGFSVIRKLVGHGVGRSIHEDPQIPNFQQKHKGMRLRRGMVIAVEPMVSMGDYDVMSAEDGWAYKTVDNSITAHFEHTIAVGENRGDILTLLR